MNQDIYFPIRSNIDFFEKKSNQPSLISKIKQSILLYENLHFDAGAYIVSCSEYGALEDPVHPDRMYEYDLTVPESSPTGFNVALKIEPNGKPVVHIPPSDKSKTYNVSFQKLITEMGIENEKFIKFGIQELTKYGYKRLDDAMWRMGDYKDFIDGTYFCKKVLLKNFFYSLLCSETIETPIMIDNLYDKLIENMSHDIIKGTDMRLDIFNKINDFLKLKLPDFSSLSIDEILDLRNDKSFRSFRDALLNVNKHLLNLSKEDETEIESLFFREILEELKEFAPSKKNLGIDGSLLILGFLPGIGNAASVAGYAKELKSYKDFQNSSIAFIMKYMD